MAGLFHVAPKQGNPLGTVIRPNGSGQYTFGLALSAGLAGLLYGYDTVSISGAIEFLRTRYTLSTTMEGLVISSIVLGAVIGAASAGFFSDRFGRRRILMVGGLFFLVAALWSAFTLGPFDLITARAVDGYGLGLTAALAVTYISESAPTDIRGTLTFSYQMLAVCGIFLTNVVNYTIASYGTTLWDINYGWRWMLGIGALPALVFLLAMWKAPESPRFLIQTGRVDEGFAVLEHVMGTQRARMRTDDIAESVRFERMQSNSFRDLFRPGLRRALVIGIFLAVFNQAIGMNAISYYGPVMFSRLGFGGDTEFLAAASVGGVELVFTVVGMYLIDSIGRKRLMVVGSSFMCLFALGIATSYFADRPSLTLVFVMLFTASFAISMGPIPWIVIPELFPTFLRGRATGICVMCLLFTNGLIAQFTPLMIDRIGGGVTFLIFAGLDFVCLCGGLALVPETMNRTLEDIDRMWRPNTPKAAAQYALATANANIRHAEATLRRVENERMQALGIKALAEDARADAQRELSIIEEDELRRARMAAGQGAAAGTPAAGEPGSTLVDDTMDHSDGYSDGYSDGLDDTTSGDDTIEAVTPHAPRILSAPPMPRGMARPSMIGSSIADSLDRITFDDAASSGDSADDAAAGDVGDAGSAVGDDRSIGSVGSVDDAGIRDDIRQDIERIDNGRFRSERGARGARSERDERGAHGKRGGNAGLAYASTDDSADESAQPDGRSVRVGRLTVDDRAGSSVRGAAKSSVSGDAQSVARSAVRSAYRNAGESSGNRASAEARRAVENVGVPQRGRSSGSLSSSSSSSSSGSLGGPSIPPIPARAQSVPMRATATRTVPVRTNDGISYDGTTRGSVSRADDSRRAPSTDAMVIEGGIEGSSSASSATQSSKAEYARENRAINAALDSLDALIRN